MVDRERGRLCYIKRDFYNNEIKNCFDFVNVNEIKTDVRKELEGQKLQPTHLLKMSGL